VAFGLCKNTDLQTLLVKHNGMGGCAALAFSYALRLNKTLKTLQVKLNVSVQLRERRNAWALVSGPTSLQLDGNPLTEEGGRAIFRAIASGLTSRIGLEGCSFMYTHDVAFSYTAPRLFSPYSLDLSRPVDYSILSEILAIATRNPRCQLMDLTHTEDGRGSRRIELEHTRQVRRLTVL
jgi:hypothetical protein